MSHNFTWKAEREYAQKKTEGLNKPYPGGLDADNLQIPNSARKFISRSVHGSGAFTDADIKKGYRCEPVQGLGGSGVLHGKKIVFEGLKGD